VELFLQDFLDIHLFQQPAADGLSRRKWMVAPSTSPM
jgi:hypothetical protein